MTIRLFSTLYATGGRQLAVPSTSDLTPRLFLERLVREGVPLPGADLKRLLAEWPADTNGNPYDLRGVCLAGGDLRGCEASYVDMAGADLTRTIVSNGSFRDAKMADAVFHATIADGASFRRADMRRVSMVQVDTIAGARQRHSLRPMIDEWLPFDRCLLRDADLGEADLSECIMTEVDAADCMLDSAVMRDAHLECVNLAGAFYADTCMDGATVYHSQLSSPTLHAITAENAVFCSNIYFVEPGGREIGGAGLRFPVQLWHYVREYLAQRKLLPPGVRADADRMLVIRLVVLLTIPVLVTLAWKHIEHAPGVSTLLTLGAISAFAARRYVTMVMQGLIATVLGRMHDAQGALRSTGRRSRALAVFLMPGTVAGRLGLNRGGRPPHTKTENPP